MSEAFEEKPNLGENSPKAGRPSDYDPAFADQALKLCEIGFTDEQLADFFDVDVRTIYRWKAKHPAFRQAVKRSKDQYDEHVELSLAQQALGYIGPDDKYYPPHPTAAIFWLKNRRPEQWRDRAEPAKIEIEFSFRRDPEVFGRTIEQFQDGKAHALIAQHPPLVQEHLRVVLENVPDERAQEVYDQALPAILAAAARGDSERPGREFAEVQQDVSEVQGGMANMDDPEEEEKATVQDAMEAVEVHNAKVRARALKKGK